MTFMNESFHVLQLDVTEDHFLSNILKINRYEESKELSKITRTVDKERY